MNSIFFRPAVYLPLKLMKVKGAIHIGAHEAEELDHYISCGVKKIIWVEALPGKQKILEKSYQIMQKCILVILQPEKKIVI